MSQESQPNIYESRLYRFSQALGDSAERIAALPRSSARTVLTWAESRQLTAALARVTIANDPVGQAEAAGYWRALEELAGAMTKILTAKEER